MLNRRLIRVKAFKVLFSKVLQGSDSIQSAEKELIASCEKSVNLYCFLLLLPLALRRVAEAKIDAGLKKFHPTEEEANPNCKFVRNKFIKLIENDTKFMNLCVSKCVNWSEHEVFVKKLYAIISTRDYFIEYMSTKEQSDKEDVALFRKIYEEELEDNLELEEILEETNLTWIEDLAFVINVVLKNMGSFWKKEAVIMPKVFLKDEDREYAIKLLTRSMVNYDEFTEIVASYIPNWDLERLVATDLVLVVMGITEAIYFETIPVKVTINEFVDISKYYSTTNSRIFVNGLLDKILLQMVKDGKVVKSGRGLVG